MRSPGLAVQHLLQVMTQLRTECPWDAEQTHRSLVTYLIEETAETVEALEAGNDSDLCEELGDLLLQVAFHAVIAAEQNRFDLADVADAVAAKLIRRHPYVFAEADVPPDLHVSWEQRKRAEKQRDSALDGIPQLSALTRTAKVLSRARSHGVAAADIAVEPIDESELGAALLTLVRRASASGLDAEQALRTELRALEATIRHAEGG